METEHCIHNKEISLLKKDYRLFWTYIKNLNKIKQTELVTLKSHNYDQVDFIIGMNILSCMRPNFKKGIGTL